MLLSVPKIDDFQRTACCMLHRGSQFIIVANRLPSGGNNEIPQPQARLLGRVLTAKHRGPVGKSNDQRARRKHFDTKGFAAHLHCAALCCHCAHRFDRHHTPECQRHIAACILLRTAHRSGIGALFLHSEPRHGGQLQFSRGIKGIRQ